jgi:hypothetical protein
MFMVDVGQSIDKSLSDKKLDASDLVNFLPLILKAPEALKGCDKILEEFKASSTSSREELIKEVKASLVLQNDKLEFLIEESLVFANHVASFVKLVRSK